MLIPIEKQFQIEYIGSPFCREFSREFAFEGESHDFTEMVYIDSGKVEIVENGKIYLLTGGDIIFNAPMEFHRIKSDDRTTPTVYNLSVILKGIIPSKLYDGVFNLDIKHREEFIKMFERSVEFTDTKDSYTGQEAADRLCAFITDICRNSSTNSNLAADMGALTYEKLVRTMHEEIYSNITLAELADKNHISISYIKLLFRTYANTTPKSYYSHIRANEAARLIIQGYPVNSIAEKMNFSTPNYFSSFFKKHFNMTPMQYKRSKIG